MILTLEEHFTILQGTLVVAAISFNAKSHSSPLQSPPQGCG